MRCSLLDLLPKILDRIEIRRIARQLKHRQTIDMCGEELLHCPAGMVLRPILNQEDRLCGFRQHLGQERRITVGSEPTGAPLIEETAAKVVDQAKDLIALASSTDRKS